MVTTYEALPGRVRFGAGALADVPAEVDRLGAHPVLLVDGLLDDTAARRVTAALEDRHARTILGRRQHVPAELAREAVAAARETGADGLLALGGGSAIGLAKAVALETGLPILAIPTTYAGSEMTPIWGITRDGRKTTGEDRRVLPRAVIYDPELTASLPPAATAASGMNAVAHCVEALWTARANPVTDAVAKEGIRRLAGGLRTAVREPRSVPGRAEALRGAWLGGTALAVAGTALHHKICHVLGGTFDLPHAEVHAIVLPCVVEHFREAAPAALEAVAGALGDEDAVVGLERLADDLGLRAGLADLGLDAAGADLAAQLVEDVAPAIPAPVTRADVRTILERAMTARGARARPTDVHGSVGGR